MFGRPLPNPTPYCHIGSVTAQISNELISIVEPYAPDQNSIYYWTDSEVGETITSEWHHLVIAWDTINNNYRLYFDGNDRGLARIHNAPVEISDYDSIMFGSYGDYPTHYFNGLIDDIRIYNRTFSDGELQLLYQFADSPLKEMIIELVGVVTSLNLQAGISNSLDAKLDNAFKALDDLNDNNDVAAVNKINAFISEVEAQRGSKISDEDADYLVSAANAIIDNLNAL